MAEKKRTKKELIEAILDYEEAALRNIVEGFPHQLRTHIKRLMRIKTLTKLELELHHVFQEAPSQRAYRFPLTKVTPENVVLSEDDPLLPIIKVADEAYGDSLVMDYYKVPTGEFGDTLASFIVREIGDAVDTSDGVAYSADFEAAAHLLTAAAGQLDDVAEALAREAGKMRNPDNLWQKVVFNSGSIKNEDGTRKCPACGGNYDECPCPGPTQSDLYEYRIEDDIMYARRKVDDTRPLGKVLADKTAEDTQKEISDSEIFTNKPESPIRKMDSDEDKKTKSMFQEMLSDEDRKAESNLILAANSVKEIVCPSRPARGLWAPGHYMNACVRCKEQFIGDKRAMECADCAYKEPNHIVVPADGEYKDSLMWVCTKCWPGTNEVLTLGRNMRIVTHCEVCGCKSENDDDLNAIWKSWIARVLRRHWEEHKA